MRHAVLTAAIDLLADGVEAATVPAIAARSGVHASSIYRRWGDQGGVLLDALLDAADSASPIPHTGSLRDDLIALLSDVQRMFASPIGAGLVEIILLTPRDEGLAELRRAYWASRHGALVGMIDAAIARGELPAGTDAAFTLELLVGPVHTRALLDRGNPDASLPARIVDSVLYGIAGVAHPLQRRSERSSA